MVVVVPGVVVERNPRNGHRRNLATVETPVAGVVEDVVAVAAVETASCRSCRSSATCTMQGNSRMSSMREV